jgi:hypothetical protein
MSGSITNRIHVNDYTLCDTQKLEGRQHLPTLAALSIDAASLIAMGSSASIRAR